MFLVIATMFMNTTEAFGAAYAICSPASLIRDVKELKEQQKDHPTPERAKLIEDASQRIGNRRLREKVSWVWVLVNVVYTTYLLVYCLYASFRAMTHKANSLWPCLEASVSIFLVMTFDDMFLYIVMRHPMVRLGLGTTACLNITPDLPVPTMQLLTQSRESRREVHDGLYQSDNIEERPGRGVQPQPQPQPQQQLGTNFKDTGAVLKHPIQMAYAASSLCPYRFSIELAVWFTITALLGDRLLKYVDSACPSVHERDRYNIRGQVIILHAWMPWVPVFLAAIWDTRKHIWLEWPNRVGLHTQVVGRIIATYLVVCTVLDAHISDGCTIFWLFNSDICYAQDPLAKRIVLVVGIIIFAVVLPIWGGRISKHQARLHGTRQKHGVRSKKAFGSSAWHKVRHATVALRVPDQTSAEPVTTSSTHSTDTVDEQHATAP